MEAWLVEYQRFDVVVQQVYSYIEGQHYSEDARKTLQLRLLNAHMIVGAILFSNSDIQQKEKWKEAIYYAVTQTYIGVRDALNNVRSL